MATASTISMPQAVATATIANGASLSDAVDLQGCRAVAIRMPAAWTTAVLTFQGSEDDSNYADVYTAGGVELQYAAAASRWIILEPQHFLGIRYLKIRSGTSGTPANQGAARSIVVMAQASA